ncbi:hypothetical protein [Virgibacillus ndiopensis]|uniref:hypothetical protein n=1 Tax=Virgibacillus ndiopensis TaxID=2004408 RepID=UPI000C07F039|nr:hypothetical protein [Virgibacillus ndiopensis]
MEKYQSIYTSKLDGSKLGPALNDMVKHVKEKGKHKYVEIHQVIPSGTVEYTIILNIYDD